MSQQNVYMYLTDIVYLIDGIPQQTSHTSYMPGVVYKHAAYRVTEESYLIYAWRVMDKHVADGVTEEPHDYDGSSCCGTAAYDALIGHGVNQRQLRRTLVSCTTQYTVSSSHHKHNTTLMHHTMHHHITNTTLMQHNCSALKTCLHMENEFV